MNALAIHLYLTITFINLVIIRLAQNYRIIEVIYKLANDQNFSPVNSYCNVLSTKPKELYV